MAKLLFMTSFFILVLSGCADISSVGMTVAPHNPYPGLFQCGGKEQQRAIMTGERPDWGSDTNTLSDTQRCKREQ
ncbi:hypothetical protein ACEZNE_005460 [Klebsiella pneumoniae]|nr:hypothetical protein [Salmonella enterica]EKX2185764.1 hypothetical protein [Citrobacter freundii]